MRTTSKVTKWRYMTTAMAAAMTVAALLLLAGTAREAEATFPGQNGKFAFASDRTTGEGVNNPEGDFEIYTMNRDGTGLTQLTENAAFDFDPEWSPDGEQIAFESSRDLFSDIFVMHADGSGQTNVTNNTAFDRAAAFSPDGRRIAFNSNLAAGEGVDNPTGDTEIFSVNLDGTALQQLTNNTARDFHPDFAPDGRKISFVSDRNFAPGIYTMNADGSKPKKTNRNSGVAFASPGWSPDGTRIVFTSDQEGGPDVYVMRANGAGQQRLTVNGLPRDASPVFSPDGRKIVFETNKDGNFEIYEMRTDGTNPVNLTDDPAADLTPDWQPLEKQY
jgi:Tol biopolymer transport system component